MRSEVLIKLTGSTSHEIIITHDTTLNSPAIDNTRAEMMQ